MKDRFADYEKRDKNESRNLEKSSILDKALTGKKSATDIILRDMDYKEMRRSFNKSFEKLFRDAYKKYISGDWANAENLLC
jgi:hypothetical protein